ncbi:MAG: hypothetical protein HYW24_00815 [Candidatus Aenigmarchaeota archaeon]|nr:hypothetical protein [Candidatus Aenigmarchaeota archaeon]
MLSYESITLFINLALSVVVVSICFWLAWKWRQRKFLVLIFPAIGITYAISNVLRFYWSVSLDSIVYLLYSAFFAAWIIFYSYATLRLVHPTEKRPANWGLLMYLSVPFMMFVTKDLVLASLQIFLISSLVLFTSSLFFFSHCKRGVKKYAVAGIFAGLVGLSYVPVLLIGVVALDPKTTYTVYMIFNLSVAYLFFGLFQTSLKKPKEFLCDYDHKKDRKK